MAESVTHSLKDGRTVQEVTLSAYGLTAKILTLGAVLRDLRLDGHEPPLVLGFQDVEAYVANSCFLGAIVGRYANRINEGRTLIDGRPYQLDQNNSAHLLHGGSDGTWAQNWQITALSHDQVTLGCTLPDGHMGFPGKLNIACQYSLLPNAMLDIQLSATTDQITLCNLAPHSYFNLDGTTQIKDHTLEIFADSYVPVDGAGIPTGGTRKVANNRHDFRAPRPANATELDVSYCFDTDAKTLRDNARLTSISSGRTLTVRSNQPGLQVFNAPQMVTDANGLNRTPYGPYCGIAFEPQIWPDAPNQPDFPDAHLHPGETYLNHCQFAFD